MKKTYTTPELKTVFVNSCDILTLSLLGGTANMDNGDFSTFVFN